MANIPIMRTPIYESEDLKKFICHQKVVTIDEILLELGNPVKSTAFRVLEQVNYISSYSHRGRFYSMKSTARFNKNGIWIYAGIYFSRYGNLIETCQRLVSDSDSGYSATELEELVGIKTRHALCQLAQTQQLTRERFCGHYVYFSAQTDTGDKQRSQRQKQGRYEAAELIVRNEKLAVEEAKAAIILFFSILDEKQRRLFAGLEALKLGHGGDSHIADILGIDTATVAKGRKELLEGKVNSSRQREAGAGRPSQEKKLRRSLRKSAK